MHLENQEIIYDLAVVGGGLTGLVTALLYSKTSPGEKVLLLEKNEATGGLALTDSKNEFHFDSVYIFPDISRYLEHLDIKTPLRRYTNDVFHYNYIDKDDKMTNYPIPADVQKLKAFFINKFPDDNDNISRLISDMQDIYYQFINNLKTRFGVKDILKLLFKSHGLLRAMNMTLDAFIKNYNFKNKEIIEILSALSGITGLPKENLNALVTIVGFMSLFKGAYRQDGRMDTLIRKLEEKTAEYQTEILTGKEISSIIKKDGIFTLQASDNSYFQAKKVITTTDTKKTFLSIIDKALLKKAFTRKIKNIEMTHSVFIMRLVIKEHYEKCPVDVGQLLYYKGKNAFSKLYKAANENRSGLSDDYYHFAIAIRNQSETGHCSLELITIPVSYKYWENIKKQDIKRYTEEIEKWENFYIDKLEKHFDSDIRQKIIMQQSYTPLDVNKRFGFSSGSIYDMAYNNKQIGPKRVAIKTPVKNLYHAKMIHGVYGAFFQSFLIVDLLTGGKINDYNYKF